MRVIGTAGHVDHGKSTLVTALTGINPDRLKEEQAREMTIELGFAWMALPDGEQVGIVDVPGHRDFIENMLAGVGGIDATVFVIAADEGVMPQTREHLAILDILQVPAGVIVLTKADLIDDPEWFDLIESDVREVVRGTVLEDAPLVRVSARSGQGLPELKQTLAAVLANHPPRPDLGRPRLPVDRIFTIPGFGTVVTGTLLDGHLRVGDEVEILPQRLRGRIRGLQTHKTKGEISVPGSRTAVNVTGLEVEQIRRGNVLAHTGKYQPSQRLDVRFRLLPDVDFALRHSSTVKFFVGAAEVQARVRLLGAEELKPGQEGWLQLELEEPVLAVKGDRYILRRPSPGETLGGGVVVDAQPDRRHKRFQTEVLDRLDALLQGSPAEVLFQASLAAKAFSVRELVVRARLEAGPAALAVAELVESGQWVLLEPVKLEGLPNADTLVMALPLWQAETQKAIGEVEQYHKSYPLRGGIPREELKSRLKQAPRLFSAAMRRWQSEGALLESGQVITRPGHQIRFSKPQQARVDQVLARFAASPYNPPAVKECQAELGEDVYAALVEMGQLVPVSGEVVFRKAEVEALTQGVVQSLEQQPTLTLAQFRDQYSTSRKYAQAFLEYLDAQGLTVREGDARRLRKKK